MSKHKDEDGLAQTVESILDMIGIDPKVVQVFELGDDKSMIYPNYMTTQSVDDPGLTDIQMIDLLEKLMTEHMLDVQHDLKMIRRYKEMIK